MGEGRGGCLNGVLRGSVVAVAITTTFHPLTLELKVVLVIDHQWRKNTTITTTNIANMTTNNNVTNSTTTINNTKY